eukprot:Opistho-2@71239
MPQPTFRMAQPKVVSMQEFSPRRERQPSPDRAGKHPVVFGIGMIHDPVTQTDERGPAVEGKRTRLLQRMKVERGLVSTRHRSRSPTGHGAHDGTHGGSPPSNSTWGDAAGGKLPPLRGATPGVDDHLAAVMSPEEKELHKLESCYRKICTGTKVKRSSTLFHETSASSVDVISYSTGPFTIRQMRSPPQHLKTRAGPRMDAMSHAHHHMAAEDSPDESSDGLIPRPVTKVESHSASSQRRVHRGNSDADSGEAGAAEPDNAVAATTDDNSGAREDDE